MTAKEQPQTKDKPKRRKLARKISLHPLTVEEVTKALLETPPPTEKERTKEQPNK
jgi:hypothetical protein